MEKTDSEHFPPRPCMPLVRCTRASSGRNVGVTCPGRVTWRLVWDRFRRCERETSAAVGMCTEVPGAADPPLGTGGDGRGPSCGGLGDPLTAGGTAWCWIGPHPTEDRVGDPRGTGIAVAPAAAPARDGRSCKVRWSSRSSRGGAAGPCPVVDGDALGIAVTVCAGVGTRWTDPPEDTEGVACGGPRTCAGLLFQASSP